MQDMAAFLLDYFDFDFTDDGMVVVLAEDPPEVLTDMLKALENDTPAGRVALYECLSMLAEADDPDAFEVDEKVCSLDMRFLVVEYLRQLQQG
jgi:hypothetical protein